MNNNGLLPIYSRVYEELLKQDKPYFFNRDLEEIILSIRFSKNTIDLAGVRKELGNLGLSKRNVDKVCSYIAWKMRLTVDDMYDIKKTLIQTGYIKSDNNHRLYLKKQNND